MERYDFLKYFQFNKFLLNFCGVLPLETWGFIPNAFLIIFPFCSTSFLVLPFFYTLIFRNVEFEAAMDIFSLLLEGIAATLQALLLVPKRKKLRNLVYLCNCLWKNVKNDEEAKATKHYASRGMYITYGFFCNVFAALINALLQPAFGKFVFDSNGTLVSSNALPYSTGSIHESILIFNIWWILQVPAGVSFVILIVGIDTAIIVFVFHACAYFKLLQFRIMKLEQSCKMNNQRKESKEVHEEIVSIVKFHQDILQYSGTVEDIFNSVVLLQTILSISAICIFGINFMLKDENMLNQLLHLVGSILQLLIFCWPPNNLQTESFNISKKLYDLPWYNFERKERKLVEIMIFRSQKVVTLSAGKFTLMSLRTFTSILSSAYSFFTLLRRLL